MKSITLNDINGVVTIPVVKANKKGKVECPFCEKKHKHGLGGGNGSRIPDCIDKVKYIVDLNGNKYYRDLGYYVEFLGS
jgi:hypothetical protein